MEPEKKEDEIKKELDKIKKSIDNMDLYELNENIGATVNKALGHVARGVEYTAEKVSKGVDKWAENIKKNDSITTQNPYSYTAQNPYLHYVSKTKKTSVCVPPSGKITGRVALIGGSIFSGFMGGLFLICAMAGVIGAGIALFLPLGLLGVWLASWGNKKIKRYERYLSYVREMQGKPFAKIERLARAIGKSKKFTLKDIREMIRDGVFPTGCISDEEDYLLLTKEVYNEYLASRTEMRRKQAEEKVEQKKVAEQNILDEKTRKVQETIQLGRDYLRQIEIANDIIEEQEFSEKLFRLQLLIDKIFHCVEQNPDKLPEIKQFMEYYLPTTLKLVNAYRDFYLQPVQGENITVAKAEIQKAVDTINIGFENLLDDLFKKDALDITSDIYVLENMLAREGLTENEFEKMKRGGL